MKIFLLSFVLFFTALIMSAFTLSKQNNILFKTTGDTTHLTNYNDSLQTARMDSIRKVIQNNLWQMKTAKQLKFKIF